DGRCETADGVLAGSALDMARAVRNTVETLGVAFDEAARMASTYPAEFLGLAADRGRIARGLRADLVQLDRDFNVVRCWP
ncbi:MAG: amidohydrolase family protein, partial [Dokdonella sp.]